MIAISCLMPTRGRHALLPRAVAGFLAQGRADAELLIVSEDGLPEGPLLAAALAGGRVRHVPCPAGLTLGAKRNFACAAARADLLLHWDDDDLYASDRITRQVAAMHAAGAALSGSSRVLFHQADGGRCWEYRYGGERRPWVCGATLAYTRAYWQRHPFGALDVGEDNGFVWAARTDEVLDLDDTSLCLCSIHPGNTSTRRTDNAWWKPAALPPVWATALAAPLPGPASPTPAPLRNVYACLVHEQPDCVVDLVRNLRHLDPDSAILLYDGSPGGTLSASRLPWARQQAQWVPGARPMRWGRLHDFALDCARYLKACGEPYDIMTIVDSDQLALRAGYTAHLARHLGDCKGIGLLSAEPGRQDGSTRIGPAVTAQQERALWLPWLGQFPDGEQAFVHWTFWPSTVLGAAALDAIVDLFDHDAQFTRILAASTLWATEEVLFPTLARLLGFRVERNPCAQNWVKFRVPYPPAQVDAALRDPAAFWMHPVPRRIDDPIRTRVRLAHGGYCAAPAAPTSASGATAGPGLDGRQLWPVLRTMRAIAGWLDDEEAELLALAARDVLEAPDQPDVGARQRVLVEIGSFCGKGTYVLAALAARAQTRGIAARVVAIDRFDGVIGSADRPQRVAPTLDTFRRNLNAHGVAAVVETIVGRAADQRWSRPIDFLLVDGLHDYASVAGDFHALAEHVTPGGAVLFHDCASYFPEVVDFVEALVAAGAWHETARAGSMRMLQRSALPAMRRPACLDDTVETASLAMPAQAVLLR